MSSLSSSDLHDEGKPRKMPHELGCAWQRAVMDRAVRPHRLVCHPAQRISTCALMSSMLCCCRRAAGVWRAAPGGPQTSAHNLGRYPTGFLVQARGWRLAGGRWRATDLSTYFGPIPCRVLGAGARLAPGGRALEGHRPQHILWADTLQGFWCRRAAGAWRAGAGGPQTSAHTLGRYPAGFLVQARGWRLAGGRWRATDLSTYFGPIPCRVFGAGARLAPGGRALEGHRPQHILWADTLQGFWCRRAAGAWRAGAGGPQTSAHTLGRYPAGFLVQARGWRLAGGRWRATDLSTYFGPIPCRVFGAGARLAPGGRALEGHRPQHILWADTLQGFWCRRAAGVWRAAPGGPRHPSLLRRHGADGGARAAGAAAQPGALPGRDHRAVWAVPGRVCRGSQLGCCRAGWSCCWSGHACHIDVIMI